MVQHARTVPCKVWDLAIYASRHIADCPQQLDRICLLNLLVMTTNNWTYKATKQALPMKVFWKRRKKCVVFNNKKAPEKLCSAFALRQPVQKVRTYLEHAYRSPIRSTDTLIICVICMIKHSQRLPIALHGHGKNLKVKRVTDFAKKYTQHNRNHLIYVYVNQSLSLKCGIHFRASWRGGRGWRRPAPAMRWDPVQPTTPHVTGMLNTRWSTHHTIT